MCEHVLFCGAGLGLNINQTDSSILCIQFGGSGQEEVMIGLRYLLDGYEVQSWVC